MSGVLGDLSGKVKLGGKLGGLECWNWEQDGWEDVFQKLFDAQERVGWVEGGKGRGPRRRGSSGASRFP